MKVLRSSSYSVLFETVRVSLKLTSINQSQSERTLQLLRELQRIHRTSSISDRSKETSSSYHICCQNVSVRALLFWEFLDTMSDRSKKIHPSNVCTTSEDTCFRTWMFLGSRSTAVERDGQVLATDNTGKPIHPVHGPDGTPLPTDASGAIIGPDGEPIPTNSDGKPLSKDGFPLPTDNNGNFVLLDKKDAKGCDVTSSLFDVIFVLVNDGDGVENYDEFKKAVVGFAKKVDMSPDVVRLAVLSVGSEIAVPLALGGYQEKEHLSSILNSFQLPPIIGTEILSPVQAASQQFSSFPRTGITKMVVIFADNEEKTSAIGGATYVTVKYGTSPQQITDTPTEACINGAVNIIPDDTKQGGEPEGPEDQKLEKNEKGEWVYPLVDTFGKVVVTDEENRSMFTVVDDESNELSKNEGGNWIELSGDKIETDELGRPLDSDDWMAASFSNGSLTLLAEFPERATGMKEERNTDG